MKKLLVILSTFCLLCTALFALSACGDDSEGDNNGETPHTHSYSAVITNPTCTEQGYTTYTCSCGNSYVSDYVDALGHTEGVAVREKEVSATCTKEGGYEEVVSCSVCEAELSREAKVIDKLAHTPGEAVHENEIFATCTKEGSYDEVVYCSACEIELSREAKTTEKASHTPGEVVVDNVVNSTCANFGSYDVVSYCTVCETEISRVTKEIAKLEHTPAEAVVENVVDATCIKEGSYDEVVYCSACGEELSRTTEVIKKLDHTPAEAVREKEVSATCTKAGSYEEVVYCSACGEELSRMEKSIEATKHNAVIDEAVAPTCTKTGLTTGSHCVSCGEIFVAQTVAEKLPHTPAAATKENEIHATCTSEGSYDEVVKCSICGVEMSRTEKVVEKLDHTPGEATRENVVEATCTATGSYEEVVKCSHCGEELSRTAKVIEKLDHTPAETVRENEKATTCTAEGSYDEVIYCSVCEAEISRTAKFIDALGHTPAEAVRENEVDATCAADGSYVEVVKCSVCGDEISRTDKVIEKLAHTEEILAAVEATCSATGLTEGKKCSVCDAVIEAQEVVEKLDHTPAEAVRENEKAATCSADGSYEEVIKCSVCNEEISRTDKVIEKLAHTYVDGKCSVCEAEDPDVCKHETLEEPVRENEVAATCTAEGKYDEVVYCAACGIEFSRETKVIAKLDTHTPAEAVRENEIAATCTAEGSYEEVVYCSVCEVEISRETKTTEKLDHHYVDGLCSECGEESPERVEAMEKLQSAIDYIWYLYRNYDKAEVEKSFDVVNSTYVSETLYSIQWSADNELITFTKKEGNIITVVIPDVENELTFVLTATIADSTGASKSKNFTITVPAFDVTSYDEYMASEDGTLVTIDGIVVGLNSKEAGNKRNHLFLLDLEGKGGYYVYNMADDPKTLGIEIGMTVRIKGELDIYNGVYEVKGATAEIIDAEKKSFSAIDLTAKLNSGADMKGYVGTLVTFKGVTLGGQELGGTSDYLFFSLNGNESYVRSYLVDLEATIKSEDNKLAIEADHKAHFGYTADVTGLLIYYGTTPYLIPVSTTPFTNYVAPHKHTPGEVVKENVVDATTCYEPGSCDEVVYCTECNEEISRETVDVIMPHEFEDGYCWMCGEADPDFGECEHEFEDGYCIICGEEDPNYGGCDHSYVDGYCEFCGEVDPDYVAPTPALDGIKPVVGTAYKFGMLQAMAEKTVYITGAMSAYYMAITEDIDAALDVYVEETEGGYYISCTIYGAKKYINMVVSGTHVNAVFEDAPSIVYTYDETLKTFKGVVNDADYVFGTRNDRNYTTVGPVKADSKPFYCVFVAVGGSTTPDEPDVPAECEHNYVDGACTKCGEKDPNYVAPHEHTPSEVVKENVVEATTCFEPGSCEEVVYCTECNEEISRKTVELTMPHEFEDGFCWMCGEDDPNFGECEHEFEDGYCTICGEEDPNYGGCDHSYVDGYCEFCGEVDPDYRPACEHNYVDGVCTKCEAKDPNYVAPEEPGDEPEVKDTLTIEEALALGASKEHNTYTEEKYYVTGVITEVYNTQYGNMKIKDEAGNILTIYGTYSADGATRYDKLEVKPVAGDTVTVYGIVGQYNGTPQIKNGWITAHTPAGSDACEHSFVDGYCEFCGEVDPDYKPACEHDYVDGACTKCGEKDPTYVPPVEPEAPAGGSTDFNSIVLPQSKPNGDASYTATYATANGWVSKNAAIQCGGATVMNPQFPVIGADNTFKAVCLNGKTSATGSLASPTLNGGISKITINYTKMFTDTALSATVTITDVATGEKQTYVFEQLTLDKNEKYVVYTAEFVLDAAITGDFTIEIVNNCPSNVDGNKDRMTILSVVWEG